MQCNALRVFLAFGLAIGSAPSHAQQAPSDPEVLKGIRQVDEGDYDAAILTLDAAARRLSRDPGRSQEVAQAYLHLGVAYLGKGHEASARAQFREALARVKDLNLTPDRFAPKVIEAFEQARAESARGAAPAPSTAAPRKPEAADPPRPAAPAPGNQGGSGKKVLIGALVLAGVGGGIAAAAGGGGSAAPTPPPLRTENFSDNLPGNANLTFPITVAGTGSFQATLTWTEPDARLAMDLHLPGTIVATSAPSSNTRATLTANVTAQLYSLQVVHRGGCGDESAGLVRSVAPRAPARPCSTSFSLTVVHP